MIRSDKQHLFPERERRGGGIGWRTKEREAAEKPVKPRQQGPACKKVKGERRGCVRGGALCSVTQ